MARVPCAVSRPPSCRVIQPASGNPGTDYTPAVVTPSTFTPERIKPSAFDMGFTAELFVEELAINIIAIGLGNSPTDSQLKRILIHTDIDTLEDCMEELRKADNLDTSDAIGGIADASALAPLENPIFGVPKIVIKW